MQYTSSHALQRRKDIGRSSSEAKQRKSRVSGDVEHPSSRHGVVVEGIRLAGPFGSSAYMLMTIQCPNDSPWIRQADWHKHKRYLLRSATDS